MFCVFLEEYPEVLEGLGQVPLKEQVVGAHLTEDLVSLGRIIAILLQQFPKVKHRVVVVAVDKALHAQHVQGCRKVTQLAGLLTEQCCFLIFLTTIICFYNYCDF